MLELLLIVLLIAAGVAALLFAGALILQGYLYSEPADGLAWRAPVAGAVMGLFFGLWCSLEARSPGTFDTVFNFSPGEPTRVEKFWAERVGELGKREVLYRRGRNERGAIVYTDPEGRPWRRVDNGRMVAIIIEEDGERKRFAAETNPDGSVKVESDQSLRYVEVGGRGRVMTEDAPGEIQTTRYGALLGNLLWNLVHLLAWFACLWLLLRFQWPHALGLAVALWLACTLLLWPVLQAQVRRATTGSAALRSSDPHGFTRTRQRMPWSPSSGSDCKWA
jgi:hypothetical protein